MDEKGANTFPFHNLSPGLKKIISKVCLVLLTISLLDKRKVGGGSCYTQQLRSNAKHPSQFSHRITIHMYMCGVIKWFSDTERKHCLKVMCDPK